MNLTQAAAHLRSLSLQPGDFAVFGSGPLLARGIISDVNDLDVIARGEAWQRAAATGTPVHLPNLAITIASFHDGLVTVGSAWAIGEVDIDELIDTADDFYGIPYVRLEHVVAYKRLAGRPKDLDHLRKLERWQRSHGVSDY